MFNYTELTTRNIGFVTDAEQARLPGATVVVCGTGGVGVACSLRLVRAGIGRLIIADLDMFTPIVITTGQLMCYEAVNAVLDRPHGTDNRGYFFNPYKGRTERPKPAIVAALMRPFVRKVLNGLMK